MKAKAILLVLIALLGVFISGSVCAETLYVMDTSQPGIWQIVPSHPFTRIQDAINEAVDGDTVLVFPGTYTETIEFLGKAIALRSTAGPLFTFIDGGGAGSVVTFASGEGPKAEIKGFTIRNGTGLEVEAQSYGGGIHCFQASPKILGNRILTNNADFGGGICCREGSAPYLSNNTIAENDASLRGGGICCIRSAPELAGNSFSENTAGVMGGGIYFEDSNLNIVSQTFTGNMSTGSGAAIACIGSEARIDANEITSNSADSGGGGIYCEESSVAVGENSLTGNSAGGAGGGIFCKNSSFSIAGNTVVGNTADSVGAGIACEGMLPSLQAPIQKIQGNLISGNASPVMGGGIGIFNQASPTVSQNTITSNSGMLGGGILCWQSSPVIIINILFGNSANIGGGICCTENAAPVITNNTVYGNSADEGGGLACQDNSSPPVTNTILWANSAATSGPEIFADGKSSPVVTYCDVQGTWPGEGNIEENPFFVDAGGLDFHIRLASLCRDSGTNTASGIPGTDYEGDSRIEDGNFDGLPVADMGADELLPAIAARFGNSNGGGTEVVNLLRVNGSAGDKDRVFTIPTHEAVTLTIDAPPGGPSPADFTLYEIWWEPGLADIALQPMGIGVSCIPMPLSNGSISPPPVTLANTIGHNWLLGNPLIPGLPGAPTAVFSVPTLPPGIYAFQGYILDNAAVGPGVSVTNAVVLKVL